MSDATLAGARFYKAELSQARFCGARMEATDFSEANLIASDLSDGNLAQASLRGANLMNASFRGSMLQGADLSGATLYGSDFRKADLRGANLRDGVVGDVGQALAFRALDVNFRSANLAGAVFDANTQLPFDAGEAASRKMVGIGVAKSSPKPSAKGNPPKKTIKAVPIQIGPN